MILLRWATRVLRASRENCAMLNSHIQPQKASCVAACTHAPEKLSIVPVKTSSLIPWLRTTGFFPRVASAQGGEGRSHSLPRRQLHRRATKACKLYAWGWPGVGQAVPPLTLDIHTQCCSAVSGYGTVRTDLHSSVPASKQASKQATSWSRN